MSPPQAGRPHCSSPATLYDAAVHVCSAVAASRPHPSIPSTRGADALSARESAAAEGPRGVAAAVAVAVSSGVAAAVDAGAYGAAVEAHGRLAPTEVATSWGVVPDGAVRGADEAGPVPAMAEAPLGSEEGGGVSDDGSGDGAASTANGGMPEAEFSNSLAASSVLWGSTGGGSGRCSSHGEAGGAASPRPRSLSPDLTDPAAPPPGVVGEDGGTSPAVPGASQPAGRGIGAGPMDATATPVAGRGMATGSLPDAGSASPPLGSPGGGGDSLLAAPRLEVSDSPPVVQAAAGGGPKARAGAAGGAPAQQPAAAALPSSGKRALPGQSGAAVPVDQQPRASRGGAASAGLRRSLASVRMSTGSLIPTPRGPATVRASSSKGGGGGADGAPERYTPAGTLNSARGSRIPQAPGVPAALAALCRDLCAAACSPAFGAAAVAALPAVADTPRTRGGAGAPMPRAASSSMRRSAIGLGLAIPAARGAAKGLLHNTADTEAATASRRARAAAAGGSGGAPAAAAAAATAADTTTHRYPRRTGTGSTGGRWDDGAVPPKTARVSGGGTRGGEAQQQQQASKSCTELPKGTARRTSLAGARWKP